MVDSWKLDGNCENCRRKNYCSKPCTLNKRRSSMIMHNAVRKVLNDRLGLDKIEEALKGGAECHS